MTVTDIDDKMADGYEYDVFISYRRSGQWPEWVENIFIPLFKHYLEMDIPFRREPKIFVDYEIDTGDSWPLRLAKEHSQSRILVALWTPSYFNSNWCMAELTLMYARENECGYRTRHQPEGLIVPATLHDGDRFPNKAKQIGWVNFQDCAHVWVAEGSETKEKLSRKICDWMPNVASAIKHVPDYNPDWIDIAYDKFMNVFEQENPEQGTLPSLG